MAATLIKDIRLKPSIGRWFEYRPQNTYTSPLTEGLTVAALDEILWLHYTYTQILADIFKSKLALASDVYDVALTQMTYTDFLAERAGQTMAIPIETAHGAITLVCNTVLATALINRVTGGKGIGQKKPEALTDIETIALTTVLRNFLIAYQQQWLDVFTVDTETMQIQLPKIRPDERLRKDSQVFVFTITLAYGEHEPVQLEFMLSLALLEKLTEIYHEKKTALPRKLSVYLSPESVNNVHVPMNVRLGGTTLSIQDVLHLEEGDVLQLNERLTDSLQLRIGDAEFMGVLGRHKDQFAVKILDRKSKYYDFQVLETVSAKPVAEPVVADVPPEPVAQVYAAPVQEAPVEIPAAEIVPPQTVTGQLSVEDIQIKDSLLEEFSNETKTSATTDEFTWDLDDLK